MMAALVAYALFAKEKQMSNKSKWYVYRSAATGKFVTEWYAKRYPHKTVRELIVMNKLKRLARKLVGMKD